MPRDPEWPARPTTDLGGREMLAIYRGRKHVATLLFPAPAGDTLDELMALLERLWKETNDVQHD